MRTTVALTATAVLAVLAVGCGTARQPGQQGAADPAPPIVIVHTSATEAGNQRLAERQARWLMSLVPLPAGAVALPAAPASLPASTMGTPGVGSLVDISRSWRLAMPLKQAMAWLRAHPPRGRPEDGASGAAVPPPPRPRLPGVPPWPKPVTSGYSYAGQTNAAWASADIEVEVGALGHGTSALRADAVVVWLDPVPLPDDSPPVRIHIDVATGCPPTDQSVGGVRNYGADLRRQLVPAAAPTAGLECTYYGMNGHPWQLRKSVRLDTAAARRVATAMARLPLSHTIGGAINCPMDDGSAEIIALSYRDRPDVDLWVKLNGCGYTANGFIMTGWQ
jgi:hypothetical protein